MNKKVLKIIGQIFTLICIGYIIYKLISLDIDFRMLLDFRVLITVIVCAGLLSTLVFLNAIAYKKILEILSDKKISQREVTDVYTTSNMGKYLPGNFMHIAGRNMLGAKYGFGSKQVLFSSFFEVGLKILVAAVFVVCLSLKYFLHFIEQGNKYYIFIIIAVVLMAVVVGAIIAYKKIKDNIKGKRPGVNLCIVVAVDAWVFFINILCFLALLIIFTGWQSVSQDLFIITGIYITAWLVGYLTPGSPGGIGVKEAALVFLLSGLIIDGDILFISVVLRVCTILGDVTAFLINKVFNKVNKKKTVQV
jgi:glycosyltransferase 2 family protein